MVQLNSDLAHSESVVSSRLSTANGLGWAHNVWARALLLRCCWQKKFRKLSEMP